MLEMIKKKVPPQKKKNEWKGKKSFLIGNHSSSSPTKTIGFHAIGKTHNHCYK